jgi:hypothetical protein
VKPCSSPLAPRPPTATEAREALLQLDPLRDEMLPAEQVRIVQLPVELWR